MTFRLPTTLATDSDAAAIAARAILDTDAEALNALLTAIGPDRDLVDEPDPLGPGWPAWDLETALWALPGIGRTKATKLIARKRPRLYPIWDSVVMGVLGTARAHLNPVREALRADDAALHHRLLKIRAEAGLPEEISALRVFDVIAWMDGKDRGLGQRADQGR
ncbi:hypothetical protein EP51_46840 (plasmid) [Rhodococcus opacus]|uniref:Uncharacterized protein n=1 Tax=Rhodococcus opacus TaxID=37919 RepID=A0A076F0G4_RHOOP|nr:hypothetical protein EP51_46840 [Rhodococcus opacus]